MAMILQDLRKLQLVQLITFLEIKKICDKHAIRYTPIGGTLIGVVRHHGFIPWDDDIDIAMLRDDYDRFYEIARTELSSEYFLQTGETDPGYPHPIMRVCINDTTCIEECDVNRKMHHGIYTDIFPYDASPSNPLKILFHKYTLKWLILTNFERAGKNKPRSIKGRILYPFFRLSSVLFSDSKIRQMLDREIQKYNDKECEYVVRTGSQYDYKKVRIKRELMEESVPMIFEGFTVSVMKGYHEHLSENYGDYMQLPPKDKQNKAMDSIVELNLGRYNDMDYIQKKLDIYRKIFLESEK